MEWENLLNKLKIYDVAFEIRQGYYHVSIKFENGWDVIIPENENIYVEERNGIHHYIAETDAVSVNEIFNCIEQTIEYNKDLQRKLELFRQKTIELQEIFSNETYEKLKTIEFTFPRQKKTSKKNKTKKKEEKALEENVDKTETIADIQYLNAVTTSETEPKDEIVVMNDGEYIEELEK